MAQTAPEVNMPPSDLDKAEKFATDSIDNNGVTLHRVDSEVVDAVWGKMGEGNTNYRNLGWMKATVLMLKAMIGLGVLALPSVLDTLGFVPGIIVIVSIAVITTWTGYVVGTFKRNHPEVYTVADVGFLLFGRVGREIYNVAYTLFLISIAGSALLSVSISFNAMTLHATCTVVFVVVACILTIMLASLRTLDKISIVGWIGVAAIVGSVFTLMISVGVQDRPDLAPREGPWSTGVKVTNTPSFVDGINAVSTVVFSFAGTPYYFNFVSEMRQPKDYNKSLVACQGIVTTVYLLVGSVVYHFVGVYIASPALGSAGPLMKRVCYGIAFCGLLASCILNVHVAAKNLFVRLLQGTHHLTEKTKRNTITWYGSVFGACLIAFIIAMSIPFFGNLVGLIGALFGTLLSFQTMAMMWIYDNRKSTTKGTMKYKLLLAWNVFIIAIGTFIQVAGCYGSGVAIHQQLTSGNTRSPFSCADNS